VIHETSSIAILFFLAFVAITLGLSFYLGSRAKSTQGYFTAHGQIPWYVNGVAFAGDYLSAASFLGICGMIAFYGYDGFLYSIGYLAGWIVALFVVAEPMKRLGKFTFADALNSKFQSRGIQLAAGVSTLAVSVFYLIPQMVGAGVLVQPLLGLPHWVGVMLVGATVIVIVVTAGMVSTTWVQFLKGALLVIFSTVLTVMVLNRGFETRTWRNGHDFVSIGPSRLSTLATDLPQDSQLGYPEVLPETGPWKGLPYVRLKVDGHVSVWRLREVEDVHHNYGDEPLVMVEQTQSIAKTAAGEILINGRPRDESEIQPVGFISHLPGNEKSTGALGPLEFLRTLQNSEVVLWGTQKVVEDDGTVTTIFYQKPTPGSRILQPGASPTFAGIHSGKLTDKLNFLSLMLALFCGTASLPHILIRYYTVKDEAAARKSTIVGIACIGFFYVLTLYMGLGAMTSGALDVTDSNMAAPLLARSISEPLFAVISAIAFTTVLGTVSGLILASAGAVSHDLISLFTQEKLTEHQQVRIAKISSVVVGVIAIYLGIKFKELNVSYLVGWAFSVAASANLPALVMVLFWRGTTHQGIIAAVLVGMISSLGWILLSGDTYSAVYGLPANQALVPFSQPGIVTIPLGFLTLVLVSLLTRKQPEGHTV
jgi:cation/acetate symporter